MVQSELEANLEQFRFNWGDLPAVTAHLPGTGGDIRVELEDFVVTEIPSYLPSGEGVHAYAFVEKRGLTTMDIADALRRQGVPDRAIGYAGQKDKYAIARQWISVPQEYSQQLQSLDELNGATVLETSLHNNKLGLGHLRGNRFEIRVRNADSDCMPKAEAIATHLKSVGLPNYFGPQRFGYFNTNAIDAIRIIRGERVPGGRRLHRFFLSALQSHVFNWLLKIRIERGLYDSVLSGDRAQKHDTGGMFVVEDGEVESPRAKLLEISAALPIFGKKVRLSTDDAGKLEQEILDKFGLEFGNFNAILGSRRASRARLDDLTIEPTDDGYVVHCTLPKGSFATSLIRELTKVEELPKHGNEASTQHDETVDE